MSGKKSKAGLLSGLLILALTVVFLQAPVYSQIAPGDVVQNDDLSNRDLSGQDLSGVVFVNVNLSGADLRNSDLTETVFSSSTDLSQADLSGATLVNANLRGAILSFASLTDVDLTGADLRGTDLSNALIVRSDFTGANMIGTDLTEANIAPSAVFTGAIYSPATDFPPGFDPFSEGMILNQAEIGEGTSAAGDLAFDLEDINFILAQIKFAERHAAGEKLSDILPNLSIPWGLRTVDGAFNNLLPGQENFGAADLEFPSDVSRTYPDAQPTDARHAAFGLAPGEDTSYATTGNVIDDTPRLISHLIVNQSTDNPAAVIAHDNENEGGEHIPGDIGGADQLFIPNTAVDEGLSAPTNAYFTFFGQFFDHGLTLVNKGGSGTVITGIQEDDPLFNKTPGNVMLLSRATLDAGPDGLIGTGDGESNPINATTPHVDQNQTYGSHVSAQILLREFEVRDDGALEDTGGLLDGHGDDMILDNEDDGGLATWGTVKAQASEKFGIELDDQDGANMPYILGDYYGNFKPGPDRGLPVIVLQGAEGDAALAQFLEDGTLAETGLAEGDRGDLLDATLARRIDHSFFLDVAHSANPNSRSGPLTPDADDVLNDLTNALPDSLGTDDRVVRGIREEAAEGEYDDELLDRHFACGDGRCNENIVLTSVHTIFHREHNRLAYVAKRVVLDAGDLGLLNEWLDTKIDIFPLWRGLSFPVSDASLQHQLDTAMAIDDLRLDWNGQRIFQAAKFGTEMQYNRIVFDEFSPTLSGLKDVFEGFHTELDPTIRGEFAHTVYRFGHSMLTETVDRFDVDFAPINGEEQLGLFEAFLNPLALYNYDEDTGKSRMTPEQAVGSVLRGSIRQVSNEIDEFVTGSMQNNVYGLPLDLGAINIQRGRETGIPKLNQARREFFAETQDYRLQPYRSWVDYLDNIRHEESIVNFIAAYGTHPFVAGPDNIIGSPDDPDPTYAGRRARACAIVGQLASDADSYCTSVGFGIEAGGPADAIEFLYGTDAWANVDGLPVTGVEDIDFWNGGLAEERMPFGGYLGSTHNYVFEIQLERLQNGDRFYYVGRTATIHLFGELESNSFTALAMRNTDLGEEGAGVLPINIFSAPTHVLEILEDEQFGDDPEDESDLVPLVIRDPAARTTGIDIADEERFIQYTGGDHVAIGGSPERDTIIGGIGDDSLWGRAGDDRIEGGDGADSIEGGAGNDIITDLSGPDVIEGGPGCDAIASGNEEDVIFGDEGDDFIVNPSEFGEIFAGLGDDKIYDGEHLGHIRGGAGDDWMENQGGGEDLFQGDNGAAAEAGEPSIKGNDVAISHDGNNDWDMENGDDIVVDGPGNDRIEGQLGFDWVSFARDRYGVDIDLDFTIFNRPVLPPSNASILNRYDRVEGVSGSPEGDILRGTGQVEIDLRGNELVVTASRDGFALIEGLNDAPGQPGLVPVSQRRDLEDDPITGEAQFGWSGGEILIGGGASDLLVGEDGDDIIDGDSALDVGLQVADEGPRGLYPSMRDLFAPVFDGTISPCDISISRVINDKDLANADTDSALYTGNQEDYSVTLIEGGNFIRVEDLRGLPIGGDGSDLVRNVERLVFEDSTHVLAPGTAGAGDALNDVATGQPEIGGTQAVGEVLTALIGSVMDASNLNGVVDAEEIAWSWESELEPGESGFSPITRVEGGDPFAIRGQSMTVSFGEAGLQVRVVGLFQDDLGVFELVKSESILIPLPDGTPAGPDTPASFVGTCEEFGDATTIVENASRAGLARLDFTTGPLPLALFRGTEFIFPAGFGPGAEQAVSNISITFVNNASSTVTGVFQPEIVAIQDLVTLAVDPNNVDVLFSLRGDDVAPLVAGPTTASINIEGLGCGVPPVVIVLDGNSSVDNAQGVVIVSVNGAPPVDPELEIAASFLGDCADLGVPGFENASRAGLPRFDFTVVGLPLASFDGANPPFTTAEDFTAEAELAIDNITLTFTNVATGEVSGTSFPEIVAISDIDTGLVTTQTEVDLLWSIRGGDVTPLVSGATEVVISVNGVACVDVLTLDGDSSLDDAQGVELTLINGADAPPPVEGPVATFLGNCANLGAPPFENASRVGLPRFDFTVTDLDLRLFSGTNPPFTTAQDFGAEAEIAIDNIILTFTNVATGVVSGTSAPEIVAISDIDTGLVTTQTEVNLLWSIRGGDVTPLVSGPTEVRISVNGGVCVDVVTLDGDSSLDDAQGVELTLVNGADAPPPVEGPTADFFGACDDVDTDTITFVNASRAGLARLDVTIPSVDLALFGPLDPAFSAGETPGCGPLPEICPGDEIAITGVTLTFVNDASGQVTGVFDPEIVAIEILDGDALGTGVAEQNTVNILFSIRGADVSPLVIGPTTADLSINGAACGVYGLDGDSSVNDALDVAVLTLDGAPAPVAPAVEGPVAIFNGGCDDLGLAGASNNSSPGRARFGFLINDVSLVLLSNTGTVFTPGAGNLGATFAADAVQAVSNVSISFVQDSTGDLLGGPFGFELTAIEDPASGFIDPNNVNLEAEVRGDDAAPLVNGPTTATISVGGAPCIEIGLTGDSAGNPEGVTIATVNGGAPPPVDVLSPATLVADALDLSVEASQSLFIENNSSPGGGRFDIGILNVPFNFFTGQTPPFIPGAIQADDSLSVGNVTAVFVNNLSNLPTGTFFPDMTAIEDPVTLVVSQTTVDLVWSIRGGDVTPLVNGSTTITFLVDGSLFATALLSGNSALNGAQGVVVEAINGAAPLAPPSRFGPSEPGVAFVRGECNGDGALDLSDIVCSLGWQFHGSFSPGCIAGLNANGDTQVNVADPIFLINYLFRAGPPPGQPYPACGISSAALDLEFGCATPPADCR